MASGTSSSRIVTVAVALSSGTLSLTAVIPFDRVTANVSVPSAAVSFITSTVNVATRSPCATVRVPDAVT